ncbi:MAG: N-acetylmuramoyl-L-alanine amidase [Bacteroides sp.]|nr:N-acetylmuramoyl-L-alanine amidase [Bacillota bacterium]MCM1393341.1 N-acetylmuramoyl-L-alanine amidase [[Eubacterium] siraeum]MCM1455435.1 N-acetylmuramoyl-L-alanine amidase [Bacteroides sp.]
MHKFSFCAIRIFKVVATALSAVFIVFALSSPLIAASAMKGDNRKVVVVDAGHGGSDGGVIGKRTGVKESDLNLKVAKLLGEYLIAGGYKVVYTRQNDTMHTHPNVRDNKKRADMFKRGDIINSAKPDAMISIHMNFYSSSTRRGAQVFFDRRSEDGREFANVMQDVINAELNSAGGGRSYTALSAEKYLLSCSPYPSIIVECGFLSNPFDEANLVDKTYQAKLAYTLFVGIDAFLNSVG